MNTLKEYCDLGITIHRNGQIYIHDNVSNAIKYYCLQKTYNPKI